MKRKNINKKDNFKKRVKTIKNTNSINKKNF